jgi:hypothetical protein
MHVTRRVSARTTPASPSWPDLRLDPLAEIDEQPSGHAQGISAYTADGRHPSYSYDPSSHLTLVLRKEKGAGVPAPFVSVRS